MSTNDEIEKLTEAVIGCAIEVHRTLGPGLMESVYRECVQIELTANRFELEPEKWIHLDYKGHRIRSAFKTDLIVARILVVEVKAVEALHPIHSAQVINYLKLTGCPAGLLMNFNSPTLKAGLKRFDHPDRYVKENKRVGDSTGEQENKRNTQKFF